ncbi:heme peroxidase [Calocera cornea HHB12733]|uniref:Heme peroxidase n=1 Tax=Calocera cornea HHB12733 TaxID=1353952 RepID=A0A165J4J4_9BASI|nr:heme peroxidase [Calocera cornea HHB12733]
MSALLTAVTRASNQLAASLSPVDTDGGTLTAPPGLLSKSITDLDGALKTGSALSPSDVHGAIDAVKNLNGNGIDDRLFMLEKVLTLMARMPADSEVNQKMQAFFIAGLYKDLPHPPSAYLAPFPTSPPDEQPKRSYNYRSTNGDHYNPAFPNLGRAGTPYSRSVPSASTFPPSALPDPGLVFDLLLSRPAGTFNAHPGGLSSLFFAMANLIIHTVFDTNRENWGINDTSSYVDLTPLYGNTVSKTNAPPEALRRLDGTGRLHEDVFGDGRLLFMPPATAVLLVLLCRNHNFIAEKILNINERGAYQNPPSSDEAVRRAQDDEIYERARLVNCGFFAKIVLYDYVGGILGLTRDGSSFRLNLPEAIRDDNHEIAPVAQGNQISCEFNILYRWHACTSAPDVEWIDTAYDGMVPGKHLKDLTVEEFTQAAAKFLRPNDPDPKKWEFGGLKRDPITLRFDDAQLATIIKNATESPAHAFGARQTPDALRVVEIMAIQQGRTWGCCTLNEFRHFFGLKAYTSFKEWNPNPEIYNTAQALYGDINNLELHVGLQAEESKGAMPGAGLCPSYTMSRALLADAFTLVRSDPYLSSEFSPYNCTSWGFQDAQIDSNDGSYGGGLTKLLLRNLPGQYQSGDAYVHFPFLVPADVKKSMHKRRDPAISKYNWSKPLTPIDPGSGVMTLNLVPADKQAARMTNIVGKYKINRKLVNDTLVAHLSEASVKEAFAAITKTLLEKNSVVRPGFHSKQVDVVQSVINMVPVYFVANHILGLPLKTDTNPNGVYRPEKLYEAWANVGNYVLYDHDAPHEWFLRENATGAADIVKTEVRMNLERLSYGIFSLTGLFDTIGDIFSSKTNHSDAFLTQLLTAGKQENMTIPDITASLFAVVIPSVPQYSAVVTQLVDFYLRKEKEDKKIDLMQMSAAGPAMDSQIAFYVKSAIHSIPTLTPAVANAINGKAAAGSVKRVEGLMLEKIFDKTSPIVLRQIFTLRNLRRAPGTSGVLPMFTQTIRDQPQTWFIDNLSNLSPWPTGLMIQYDA